MNHTDLKNFQLVYAESGDVNLFYKNTYLHCNNNPQTEALAEFAKLQNTGVKNIVIIIGLGLGYLLKRIFLSSKCKIIVYEPDNELMDFTLKAVDFNEELTSGRVAFTSSMEELNGALSKAYGYKDNISLLKLKSADLLYTEEIKYLLCELPMTEINLQSNFSTLAEKSFPWLANGLFKLKHGKPDYYLNILENKFRDKAALIISAGPSLDKDIETIKSNRHKFIIFCVNVAYKKLVENKIIPDFVLYIDEENYTNSIKNFEHSQVNVINHFNSYAIIFEKLSPKRFFTFYCNNDLLSRWLANQIGFSIEKYEAKGSVSHLALLSAHNMGCNPIILTGQDLAYTGGKYYSDGSYWSEGHENKKRLKEKIDVMEEMPFIEVKGQNGEILRSTPDYAGFIKHFEEFAAENGSSIKLFNCSAGGAQINGFENKLLEELIGEIEPVNIELNSFIDNILQNEPDLIRENYLNINKQLEKFYNDMQKTIKLAKKGVEYSKELRVELQKRHINTHNVKVLTDKIIALVDEIEACFFKKWEFSIYFAFKEILELYATLDDEAPRANSSLFANIQKDSYALFSILCDRIKLFF